ncbi:MAG: CPXCG motif-containing cysteine-rich protein [Pseudomonadota bacterium]|nr:CPXCG motif-containing cysteine-rich protein [Pseudomonadota bacterium]
MITRSPSRNAPAPPSTSRAPADALVLEDVVVSCPYCGEEFGTVIDGSAALDGAETADYYEDCAVCCRPIRFVAHFDFGGSVRSLDVRTDAD